MRRITIFTFSMLAFQNPKSWQNSDTKPS